MLGLLKGALALVHCFGLADCNVFLVLGFRHRAFERAGVFMGSACFHESTVLVHEVDGIFAHAVPLLARSLALVFTFGLVTSLNRYDLLRLRLLLA